MTVSVNGFNENTLTFVKADTVEIKKGDLVKLTDNYTVSPCASGDEFVGVCVNVNGSTVAVQVSGYVKMPYATGTYKVGYMGIGAHSNNKVVANASAKKVLVVEKDAEANEIGFIF